MSLKRIGDAVVEGDIDAAGALVQEALDGGAAPHHVLNDGLIAGEQVTPGAPWRIVVTDALRARFAGHAPAGYVPMVDAMRILGVSRQTVLQRVKRGELDAIHVSQGKRKGLKIKLPDTIPDLFDDPKSAGG